MKNKNKNINNAHKIHESGFTHPEGYFENFELRIQNKLDRVNNGFKTPPNYFDEFDHKLMQQINLEDPKNIGFKTPINYFDDFERKIQSQVKPPKIISLTNSQFIKIISISIAAMVLLFFGIKQYNNTPNYNNIDQINIADIETWMNDDLIDFDTYDISETFSESDLNLASNEDDEILDYVDYTDIENLILEN